MGTVTFDGTRVNAADTAGTVWLGGGAAETDFSYQNGISISVLVKATESGLYYYNAATSHDYSGTNRTAILKATATNYGTLDAIGFVLEIGTGSRVAYYRYYVAPTAAAYPISGGWLIVPINPNIASYRDATVGSPTVTTINHYGVRADFSTTAKSQNVGMDAIDFITNGTGLTITSTSSTFTDFVTFDEGTSTNRYGIVLTKEGIIYVTGVLTLGTAVTSVGFSDSNQTLVFPSGRFDTGFCGLDIDLSQATTTVTITSCTFIGRGRRGYGDFDTTTDVNGTTEVITTNQAHDFVTADAATYSKGGGTGVIGLTDGTVYYINAISTTTLYVYDTKANATAGTATGRQNLTATAAAASERHSLTRTTDTRPDLGVVGTNSTNGATIDACAFSSFNVMVLTSKVTVSDSTFNNCQSLTQSTAVIDNCVFNTPPALLGTAFMTANDPAKITNSTFVSGSFGHAIELTSTTGSPFSFSGNIFTGYGPAAITFNTTSDVNAATDVVTEVGHGYTTGAAVRYMKHGGAVNMGLTDNTTYYVRAVTADTLGFFESKHEAVNNLNITPLTSTGAETHSIYSMNAAIYNNSGGAITLNVTNGGTYPLSVRNSSTSSTTVSSSVSVTVTIKDQDGVAIPGVEVAIFQDITARTLVLASTPTNEAGEVITSVASSLGPIIIRARQSTSSTTFLTSQAFTSELLTTIESTHNFSTGDTVVYSNNGGSAAIGLTESTSYYVRENTANTLYLYDTAAHSVTGGATGLMNLTTSGAETHVLNPIRYVPASATGTIGAGAFSAQITMITDSIATG